MKKLVLCVALLSLLGLGSSAFAVKDALDAVPAATLLLPYFEVDLANPNGITTLFSINNASAATKVAHVTVWSDNSIAVLDFSVYLTGYDVATINMRDILNLDFSGINVNPASGAIYGDWSEWEILGGTVPDFPKCDAYLPELYIDYDTNHPGFKTHVQRALTGLKSNVTGLCYGWPYGDNIARGYVTVDVVSDCTLLLPYEAAYYQPAQLGSDGVIQFDNVLWGDYFYITPGENYAQGDTLVHVEAFPGGYVAGESTFYGRYFVSGGSNYLAVDEREPLPTTWASRFLYGGAFTGGTEFIVWREGVRRTGGISTSSSSCAGTNGFYGVSDYAFFDEQENPWQKFCISGDPTCEFGTLEAERIFPADLFFPMPWDFGWAYLNLQWTANANFAAQSYVSTMMSAEGRYAVGFSAIGLDNANAYIDVRINPAEN